MAPQSLLGPPELRNLDALPIPRDDASAVTGVPFVDRLLSSFNEPGLSSGYPRKGHTGNNSATYLSSGSPCLDFFFQVVPSTPPDTLTARLGAAWAQDPVTALKLVCHLRGVRGTGKSDKEGYHSAAHWMFQNHPRTLALNVREFAEFGYFKDLLEMLYRLIEGSDVRSKQREEWLGRKTGGSRVRRKGKRYPMRHLVPKKRKKDQKSRSEKSMVPRDIRVANAEARSQGEKRVARELREEKRISMAKKLVERYNCDVNFQLLYDCVAEHFAECLRRDLGFLASGETRKISLAAKWCPSVDSSFDLSLLLCEAIGRQVFPRESYPEYDGIEEAHYAYRVRDRLRKDVLVPLRKALDLPEVYIGANRWDLIPYERVASVAMKFYKEKFLNHDKERFQKYLEKVESGQAKIAAGALLPHEIIASLGDDDGGIVASLQWERMVCDLAKEGKLENSIGVCDVSGSMWGIPMEVSVALGILVSELSKEPWKGKVITFSKNPQLHVIKGEGLRAKVDFVRSMDWGENTDFQKVFDRILRLSVEGHLKPEDMVKKVFVFSDMEFDEASSNPWETDYEAICRKFEECGYGSCVPQIVFWNLRESMSTPVMGMQKGVALVSGFSKNILKLFLKGGGFLNPVEVMMQAISGPEYVNLRVVD
ncbi:hypothetical protein MLD38_040346 [Melastoma candidum]|uniref:Uncharacterized protein n=1 Tax=Melastoma candidum TaxID=119954 RepID=A0ACB9L5E9_9MYRT|nr:hypothetical protein MLD38_040346 [Melastoma candidum]